MNDYLVWKRSNPLYGKTVSVLSDSVSARQEDIPEGYEPAAALDSIPACRTWWFQVQDYFGLIPLRNASRSGSRISSADAGQALYPAGCNRLRLEELADSRIPDLILVLMGNEDVAAGVPLYADASRNLTSFGDSARVMLDRLKETYPDSRICVLAIPRLDEDPSGYNSILERVCEDLDLEFLPLSEEPVDSEDGLTPSLEGMDQLAEDIIYALADENGSSFLDDYDEEEEYEADDEEDLPVNPYEQEEDEEEEPAEQIQEEDEEDESPIFGWLRRDEPQPEPEEAEEESSQPEPAAANIHDLPADLPVEKQPSEPEPDEYPEPIRLSFVDMPQGSRFEGTAEDDPDDSEDTRVMELAFTEPKPAVQPKQRVAKKPAGTIYEKKLRLKNLENGEEILLDKEEASLGRQLLNNDIILRDGKISRTHAQFVYRNGMWYVMDLGSANGTYLNGKRLLPNVQYLVKEKDTVRFSASSMQFLSAPEPSE